MSTFVAKESATARRLGDHRVVDHELDRDERIDAAGLPPRDLIASRMAARSTIAGTPVRSCMRTRSGLKPISPAGAARRPPAAPATASTSDAWTLTRPRVGAGSPRAPSGRKAVVSTSKRPERASSRWMLSVRSPTEIVDLELKLSEPWPGSVTCSRILLPWFGSDLVRLPIAVGSVVSQVVQIRVRYRWTASGASTTKRPTIQASASQTSVAVEPREEVGRDRRRGPTDHERPARVYDDRHGLVLDANAWSQPGMLEIGTKADDANVRGRRIGKPMSCAVSLFGRRKPDHRSTPS